MKRCRQKRKKYEREKIVSNDGNVKKNERNEGKMTKIKVVGFVKKKKKRKCFRKIEENKIHPNYVEKNSKKRCMEFKKKKTRKERKTVEVKISRDKV